MINGRRGDGQRLHLYVNDKQVLQASGGTELFCLGRFRENRDEGGDKELVEPRVSRW